MPRIHKKVPGTTLHRRSTLRGTRELEYFFYKNNFIRTSRLKWVKKQEQAKNNCQAEISQKQFSITSFTRGSSTKC